MLVVVDLVVSVWKLGILVGSLFMYSIGDRVLFLWWLCWLCWLLVGDLGSLVCMNMNSRCCGLVCLLVVCSICWKLFIIMRVVICLLYGKLYVVIMFVVWG